MTDAVDFRWDDLPCARDKTKLRRSHARMAAADERKNDVRDSRTTAAMLPISTKRIREHVRQVRPRKGLDPRGSNHQFPVASSERCDPCHEAAPNGPASAPMQRERGESDRAARDT